MAVGGNYAIIKAGALFAHALGRGLEEDGVEPSMDAVLEEQLAALAREIQALGSATVVK